jgi:hypothetical protein
VPQNQDPKNARAADLAAIVRGAWRRLFICERHQIRRQSPETCELCTLERLAAIHAGRAVEFQSIPQIMNAWPGGAL